MTCRRLLYASALCFSPVMAQIGQRRRTRTNRIIAGVVVAVAAVLFLIFLYFYLRRRRRRCRAALANGPGAKLELDHQPNRPSPQTTNTFHASNTPYTKPHQNQNQKSSHQQDLGQVGYNGGTLGYDNPGPSGRDGDVTPYHPSSGQPSYAPPAHPPPSAEREEQPASMLKTSGDGEKAGEGREHAHAPPPYDEPSSDSKPNNASKSDAAPSGVTYEPPNTPPPVATTSHNNDFVGGFRPQ